MAALVTELCDPAALCRVYFAQSETLAFSQGRTQYGSLRGTSASRTRTFQICSVIGAAP
jgi:hypothetical protein